MLRCRRGEHLEHHEVCRAGDFVCIPAGVPHLPANLTAESCECVVARTDAGDQESVVLCPDLDLLDRQVKVQVS